MQFSKPQITVLFGDSVVLALVTLYGLQTHQILDRAATDIWRTLLPWLVAWVIIGSYVGVFAVDRISWQRALGLPLWGMVLASPLAGFLRAALLDRAVIVIFVVLFGGICALAVTAWRGLYWLLARRNAARG